MALLAGETQMPSPSEIRARLDEALDAPFVEEQEDPDRVLLLQALGLRRAS